MLPRRIAQHTAAASHQNLSCQQQISSIAGTWAITSMIDPFPFELSAAVVAMFHSMNQSRHDLKAGENSSFSAIDVWVTRLIPPWTCTWPGGFTPSTAELWDETPGVGWYIHMLCTLCLCIIHIYIYIYISVCVCMHIIHEYMCIVHHICNTHTHMCTHTIYIYMCVCAHALYIYVYVPEHIITYNLILSIAFLVELMRPQHKKTFAAGQELDSHHSQQLHQLRQRHQQPQNRPGFLWCSCCMDWVWGGEEVFHFCETYVCCVQRERERKARKKRNNMQKGGRDVTVYIIIIYIYTYMMIYVCNCMHIYIYVYR